MLFFDGIPEPLEKDISVFPDVISIIIDGSPVFFPILMSYNEQGGGTTYVRLRDLAPSHYFDVIWNGEKIIVKTGTWYTWLF